MKISKLSGAINPSPTLKLNDEARRLRESGEPVINLSVGEPKNRAPQSAVDALIREGTAGNFKYAPSDGNPDLKESIAVYTKTHYNRSPAASNIVVSTGAKHTLFNVLYSIVDPGSEVIILTPYWVSYPEMIRMVGGTPVVVDVDLETFQPTPDNVLSRIVPHTRAIIINSPNNPSGAVYPANFIAQIAQYCEENEIYLIMDDIYHRLVFGNITAANAYTYTDREIDDSYIIVINGVSKLYGMTGLRIGWCIANTQVAKTMTKIQSQVTSCPSTVSQAAAVGALNGDQACVDDLLAVIRRNREICLSALSEIPGVRIAPPDGTFYSLPDFSAYDTDSNRLAQFLLTKALVCGVPGAPFGADGHLRFSFSGSADELEEGLRRVRWALDPEAPSELNIGSRKLVKDWH
jgi:aspartate aminotransferase